MSVEFFFFVFFFSPKTLQNTTAKMCASHICSICLFVFPHMDELTSQTINQVDFFFAFHAATTDVCAKQMALMCASVIVPKSCVVYCYCICSKAKQARCALVLHPNLFNKYIPYQHSQTHNSLFEFTACFLSFVHIVCMCTSLHNLKENICHGMY